MLACGFTASQTEAFIGDSVTLTATVHGGQGSLTYEWAALESDGVELVGDGAEATATFSKAGRFGFRLTVTDSEAAEPVSAVREGYVYVVPRSVTVALGEDIQTAVDAAIDGQEIVLADGHHVIPLQISVDKAIRIVGSGYDTCTVELDPANKNAGGDYNARYTRVLYVNHPDALVSGTPGSHCFPVVAAHVDRFADVSDEYMLKGMKLMLTEGKLLAEPSSCIGIGAVLEGLIKVKPEDKVCFIISGGSVGLAQLKILEEVTL